MSNRRRRSCLKQANGQLSEDSTEVVAVAASGALQDNDLTSDVNRVLKRRVSFSAKNEIKEFRKDVSSDVSDSSIGMDMTMLSEPGAENEHPSMYEMSMEVSAAANSSARTMAADQNDQDMSMTRHIDNDLTADQKDQDMSMTRHTDIDLTSDVHHDIKNESSSSAKNEIKKFRKDVSSDVTDTSPGMDITMCTDPGRENKYPSIHEMSMEVSVAVNASAHTGAADQYDLDMSMTRHIDNDLTSDVHRAVKRRVSSAAKNEIKEFRKDVPSDVTDTSRGMDMTMLTELGRGNKYPSMYEMSIEVSAAANSSALTVAADQHGLDMSMTRHIDNDLMSDVHMVVKKGVSSSGKNEIKKHVPSYLSDTSSGMEMTTITEPGRENKYRSMCEMSMEVSAAGKSSAHAMAADKSDRDMSMTSHIYNDLTSGVNRVGKRRVSSSAKNEIKEFRKDVSSEVTDTSPGMDMTMSSEPGRGNKYPNMYEMSMEVSAAANSSAHTMAADLYDLDMSMTRHSPLPLNQTFVIDSNQSGSSAPLVTFRGCNTPERIEETKTTPPLNLTKKKYISGNPVVIPEFDPNVGDGLKLEGARKPPSGIRRKKNIPVPHNSAFGRFGSAKTPRRQLPQDVFSSGTTVPRNLICTQSRKVNDVHANVQIGNVTPPNRTTHNVPLPHGLFSPGIAEPRNFISTGLRNVNDVLPASVQIGNVTEPNNTTHSVPLPHRLFNPGTAEPLNLVSTKSRKVRGILHGSIQIGNETRPEHTTNSIPLPQGLFSPGTAEPRSLVSTESIKEKDLLPGNVQVANGTAPNNTTHRPSPHGLFGRGIPEPTNLVCTQGSRKGNTVLNSSVQIGNITTPDHIINSAPLPQGPFSPTTTEPRSLVSTKSRKANAVLPASVQIDDVTMPDLTTNNIPFSQGPFSPTTAEPRSLVSPESRKVIDVLPPSTQMGNETQQEHTTNSMPLPQGLFSPGTAEPRSLVSTESIKEKDLLPGNVQVANRTAPNNTTHRPSPHGLFGRGILEPANLVCTQGSRKANTVLNSSVQMGNITTPDHIINSAPLLQGPFSPTTTEPRSLVSTKSRKANDVLPASVQIDDVTVPDLTTNNVPLSQGPFSPTTAEPRSLVSTESRKVIDVLPASIQIGNETRPEHTTNSILLPQGLFSPGTAEPRNLVATENRKVSDMLSASVQIANVTAPNTTTHNVPLPHGLETLIDSVKVQVGHQKVQALRYFSNSVKNLSDSEFKATLTEVLGFVHPTYIAYLQKAREFRVVNSNKYLDVTEQFNPSTLYVNTVLARFKRNL